MSMPVELHNTDDATLKTEVPDVVEHVLGEQPGDWSVSIVGSRAREDWVMKPEEPNGSERSYTLAGSAGEHEQVAIGKIAATAAAEKDVTGLLW
jgi:hypothetical protein